MFIVDGLQLCQACYDSIQSSGRYPIMLAVKTIANPKSAATSEKTENPAHAPAKPTLNPAWTRLALGLQSSDTALRRPATPGLQFKLTINQPGDEDEQEADRVSEQVMRMTGPGSATTGSLQRKCACGGSGQAGECDECRQEQGPLVQRRATRETGSVEAPPNVHEVLGSPGQALDPATRAFYEMRFGHDFGDVRIHTDAKAAESARSVDALAYTAGRNVVFGAGQYTGTPQGRHLLAHELTHVVQQTGAVTDHIQDSGVRI